MLSVLASEPVQRFLREHEHEDERALVLKHQTLFNLPASLIANQIACRRKAKEKLPLWYAAKGVVYPPSQNLEQSSSQATAVYKASVAKALGAAGRGADLTGGFGVDSCFLASVFSSFQYAEPSADLVALARHNHLQLGTHAMTYHTITAEDFLRHMRDPFSFLFVDPSRRVARQKTASLHNSQPDVLNLLPQLFNKSGIVMIKASPLLDITAACHALQCVEAVHVVSVSNECKELLFVCRKSFTEEPLIHAVDLAHQQTAFSFRPSEEKSAESFFSEPLEYVYEPNASLMKAGAFKLTGHRFKLAKLHVHTHLYTSANPLTGFPGRVFRVKAITTPKEIRKHIPGGKANILCRNYPQSAEALKRTLNLEDGGPDYVLGVTTPAHKRLLVAERIR
jgi:hypothetical protein